MQSMKLDPQGRYIKNWCNELEKLSEYIIHTPWAIKNPFFKTNSSYPQLIGCERYSNIDKYARKRRYKKLEKLSKS